MKNILFVASECVPFIKTGGLADVVGSLPKYFPKEYFDVRVVIPKYAGIKEQFRNQMQYVTNFYMDLNWRQQYVGIFEMEYEGIKFYFIDNEEHFGGSTPYAGMPWDLEKFAYFSKAALSILPTIGFRPDLIHCHDWQTGLVPVYLHERFQADEFYRGIKTVMTIHNLKFQGIWDLLRKYEKHLEEGTLSECVAESLAEKGVDAASFHAYDRQVKELAVLRGLERLRPEWDTARFPKTVMHVGRRQVLFQKRIAFSRHNHRHSGMLIATFHRRMAYPHTRHICNFVSRSIFMMSDPISVITDSFLFHPVSSSFYDVLPEFFSSRKYRHKKDSEDTFFSHFTLSSLFCPYLFPQFFFFSLYFFHFF